MDQMIFESKALPFWEMGHSQRQFEVLKSRGQVVCMTVRSPGRSLTGPRIPRVFLAGCQKPPPNILPIMVIKLESIVRKSVK